ncbi:hypothetical protein, partial [Kitasatospora sp. NPDC057198]|uniref:hypothetical protein n=1 Tax=Kitasatospora sp. NPDC057198 TaxID=3346046 RepID=UPI003632811C
MAATADGSWAVTLDYSHDAALALAVRDALGLADPLGLPPVDPPLALAAPAGPDPSPQWRAWWDDALTDHSPGAFPQLDGPLGEFVRRHDTELLTWSSARKRELAAHSRTTPGRPRAHLARVLRERAERAGVRIQAFRLHVLALPVAGPLFRPVRDGLAVTSIALVGGGGGAPPPPPAPRPGGGGKKNG